MRQNRYHKKYKPTKKNWWRNVKQCWQDIDTIYLYHVQQCWQDIDTIYLYHVKQCWQDIDTIYLYHASNELLMTDFDHLDTK